MRRKRFGVSKKQLRFWRLCIIAGLICMVMVSLDRQLRPVISTMAAYQCRVVSVLAMNEAVMEELDSYPDEAQDLAHVQKDANGRVTSIEIDSTELNRLKTRLTAAVSVRLMELEQQTISIPVGTLLGWQLLAGRGPNVKLQVMPTSFVQATTKDVVDTAGINQTNHRIFIHFTVEMSAIFPGYSTNVTVENEVCVAETVIVGEVPQFYAVTQQTSGQTP